MSHRTPPSRYLAQARYRVTIALAVLAVPAPSGCASVR